MKQAESVSWNADVFRKLEREWAVLTAGPLGNCNAMTINWGSFGTLWNKPVATAYIKPVRFTHAFLCANEMFTISFFGPEYRKDLEYLGRTSGQNEDKLANVHFTPLPYEQAVVFQEALCTLVCKKIYQADLPRCGIPQEVSSVYYRQDAPHTMFVGEVIAILSR